LNNNVNIAITVEAWKDILLERLVENIIKQRILNTWSLHDSIFAKVIGGGETVEAVALQYLFYGKFVEMGVGKGVTLTNRTDMQKDFAQGFEGTSRRPRKWASKTIYSQTLKLKDLLATKYTQKAALTIIENLDDNALKWTGRGL